jgi:hypothetical protein
MVRATSEVEVGLWEPIGICQRVLRNRVPRQTTLYATAALLPGNPLILGSLDLPGTNRHQQVEPDTCNGK